MRISDYWDPLYLSNVCCVTGLDRTVKIPHSNILLLANVEELRGPAVDHFM